MAMMLVTGGAGFIGSHVVDWLIRNGHQVTVFDNLSLGRHEFLRDSQATGRLAFHSVDVRDREQVRQLFPNNVNTVFHLAANSDISKGASDPDCDFEHTIVGTFNVLEAMREKNCKQIVFLSGSGVYGNQANTLLRENQGPFLPISLYGASKLSAEALISAFAFMFDMRASILRLANVVGPRLTHSVVYDFVHRLQKDPRHLRILGNGEQRRSYLSVHDIVKAIEVVTRQAQSPVSVFNVAGSDTISVNMVADIICEEMGVAGVQYEFSGGPVGWNGDVPAVTMDSSLIRALGWKESVGAAEAVRLATRALIAEPVKV